MAAIDPTPIGTASCIYLPLFFTKATASSKLKAFAHTKAEYSPRLSPATTSALIPLSSSASFAAIEVIKIAGCVFSVISKSSLFPLNISSFISKLNISFALSKISLHLRICSYKSFPIPIY